MAITILDFKKSRCLETGKNREVAVVQFGGMPPIEISFTELIHMARQDAQIKQLLAKQDAKVCR